MGMAFVPLETNKYLSMNAIAIHSKYGVFILGMQGNKVLLFRMLNDCFCKEPHRAKGFHFSSSSSAPIVFWFDYNRADRK